MLNFYWLFFFIVNLLVATGAAWHALLHKRNPRAALGWIAVCLMFPPIGPICYYLFGINRILTRAKKLEAESPFKFADPFLPIRLDDGTFAEDCRLPSEFVDINRVSDSVSDNQIVCGNHIELLHNGEMAYPEMLAAINNATESVYLATFIFEANSTGKLFIDALEGAVKRGCDVKVLLDGIGELYYFPLAGLQLKKKKIRVAKFLPPRLFPPSIHINLRNHRKILVTDHKIAFTGGMNIGDRHNALNSSNPSRVIDLHFKLTGPVVNHLEKVFIEDWRFATGDDIAAPDFTTRTCGNTICRVIKEGPNEDFDKLASILIGCVASAKRNVSIMTPYFLPSRELISALQGAALRGVEVNVILPEKNNLPYVDWASRNMHWEILNRGAKIFFQPAPFVHTKLFIIDNGYAQIGSANIDARSLRLNFEVAVEIYDRQVVHNLMVHFRKSMECSKEITLAEADSRPLMIKTRDAVAWLFSHYL